MKFFKSLAKKFLGKRYFRFRRAFQSRTFDEVDMVYDAIGTRLRNTGVMIDVGAHFGESFTPFAAQNWKIHAFEPNPNNWAQLQEVKSFLGNNVEIVPFAVSDKNDQDVDFFISKLSSGITSMHSFHETHVPGFSADTVNLKSYCENGGISNIDFLKIDTEGHDLFVLEGLSWDNLPSVIICEFEDKKTLALGYKYEDLADLLLSKGYAVYVSEWHPIIEYGAAHKWNRLFKYPNGSVAENAWGNILAVQPNNVGAVVEEKISESLFNKN